MNNQKAPPPERALTPDEMRFQMRRVEGDVFKALNALWFAVNKQLVRQVGLGLGLKPPEKEGDEPTPVTLVECVLLTNDEGGAPIAEQFTADNHIDALKSAGAWAHQQLVQYHQATNGNAADYFASVKAMLAMGRPSRLKFGRN